MQILNQPNQHPIVEDCAGYIFSTCRLKQLPISGGMLPVRLLEAKERDVRAERPDIWDGTGPVRLREVRLRTVTRFSPPHTPHVTLGQPQGPFL